MTWKCIFEGNRSRGRKDYFNCGDKAVPFLFLSVQVCLSRRGDDGLGNFLSCSCRQYSRLSQLQRLEKCIPILVRSSKNDSPLPPLSERNAAEIWIMRGMFFPVSAVGMGFANSSRVSPDHSSGVGDLQYRLWIVILFLAFGRMCAMCMHMQGIGGKNGMGKNGGGCTSLSQLQK